MRILFISSQFPPEPGGGGAYTQYLSHALCDVAGVRSKCDVIVLTSCDGPPKIERLLPNLEIHRGSFSRNGKVPYQAAVTHGLSVCASFRPQVIHGQHFDGAYVATQLKAAYPRVAACVTFHKSPSGARVRGQQRTDPQMTAVLSYLPAVDKIITTCLVYRREFVEIGVPLEKLALIWPGIDSQKIATTAAGLKTSASGALISIGLDRTKYKHLILCPARLDPTKDLETFIRAAGLLTRELKPSDGVAFLIAGKSRIPNQEEINYQRDLINIAEREGIAGRVYFGSFELSDMFAIYKMCAIAVLPSVREAFGLVLLESMALMIPVIAANSPGMVDVVSDGVNALTFPPRDHRKLAEQMRKILENTELAKRLRDTGLKTVLRRFDHARMADDHYGLYRTLLQR